MSPIEEPIGRAGTLRVTLIADNMIRIRFARTGEFTETGLERYGFLDPMLGKTLRAKVSKRRGGGAIEGSRVLMKWDQSGGLTIVDKQARRTVLRQKSVELAKNAAVVRFGAAPTEDWIGFGDQTRDRLYHRGSCADLSVRNVKSYVPVPFFMSTAGYGILVNTTHRIVFDMAKSQSAEYFWRDQRGEVDYVVMLGDDFKSILQDYTELTGKPKLPPEWAFGLWYLCRTRAADAEVINDALNFRREEIPCDVIGLEPGWMETYYDLTTAKKWNKERFPIPSWVPNGPHNFTNALKRMGFRLELWLCNDYDLSFEEERRRGLQIVNEKSQEAHFHKDGEVDEHFTAPRLSDQITVPGEAWFDHLKKFVDQGADFFKQDGAFQVQDHPDRVWGNGMLDAEMHNLYPLLYARQMYEGFAEHAGRRPVVFTVSGWAGFQAWCGTWTGDTGGRLETLGGMLNTSIVGHSWATNDMEVAEQEGIHFGYLQPWSQINSWYYFRMPWIQGERLLETHKFYSRLRSRLVPYLYAWAYQSTRTGLPLLLPLTLEYPHDPRCRTILHQYLLGRDLMVGIYKKTNYFPEGRWKDYWTGEVVEGGKSRAVTWPSDRGGSLYVREGAVIPFGPIMQYRQQKPLDEIELYVFPGQEPTSFEFYEDDGVTFQHVAGEHAITEITTRLADRTAWIEVKKSVGHYDGQPERRAWSLVIALDAQPVAVKLNRRLLPADAWSWDSTRGELAIPRLSGERLLLQVEM